MYISRRCSPEFVRCASELLSLAETEEVPLEASRLADTLDEIIVAIGSQIQGILKHLPDDRKTVSWFITPLFTAPSFACALPIFLLWNVSIC